MPIIEILIILFIALFVSGVFSYVFKNKGQGSVLFFFLIVFLSSWAARLWIVPIGPAFLGLAWIPVLKVAAIFAFILAVASSIPENSNISQNQNKEHIKTDEDKTTRAISGYIWVLLANFQLLLDM